MNGWLVHFPLFTVWIQAATSHVAAHRYAEDLLYDEYGRQVDAIGSTQVRGGKPGPRRPA